MPEKSLEISCILHAVASDVRFGLGKIISRMGDLSKQIHFCLSMDWLTADYIPLISSDTQSFVWFSTRYPYIRAPINEGPVRVPP